MVGPVAGLSSPDLSGIGLSTIHSNRMREVSIAGGCGARSAGAVRGQGAGWNHRAFAVEAGDGDESGGEEGKRIISSCIMKHAKRQVRGGGNIAHWGNAN